MTIDQIRNQDSMPAVNTDLFAAHESSQYAVGIVGLGDGPLVGLENEYHGYLLLRGNVYAKQENYMPVEDLHEDGTETDSDDMRSVHFAVIENAVTNARVVGAMRLIIKSRDNPGRLPVEDHYPEAFAEAEAPYYSTEVSRLIGSGNIKWLLFAAGVTYVTDNELGPVLAAVKEKLGQSLLATGVPVTELTSAKYVPEFNAKKQAIRIDIGGLTNTLEKDRPDLLDAMNAVESKFVYSGELPERAESTANVTSVA